MQKQPWLRPIVFAVLFAASFLLAQPAVPQAAHRAQATASVAPPVPSPAQTVSASITGWGTPAVIYDGAWPDPLRFSLDDAATRLVALIPSSGSDEHSRTIVVSEFAGGAWQAPIVIAQNGAYSDAPMQWLPQQTHPVISGDGNTIAYVGYTGTTFGAYIVNRQSARGWSAPVLLDTGFANTHYWIDLSHNGNTLALSDYPFLGTQHLYVLTREAGVWGPPLRISTDSGPNQGGGMPSLSADGAKLAFIANARVMFSEQIGGQWTTPHAVTSNHGLDEPAEYPQMSGDGHSLYYWLETLVPEDGAYVRTAQNLFLMRRESGGWGAPQQVNATPILPSSVTDGPAAADRYATRILYTRPVTTTDPGDGHTYVYASHLELSEWISSTWQTTRLVEANGFGNHNKWPRLTPDGKTLVFDGGIRYTEDQTVYGALWKMTATGAPPIPPWAFSITGLIGQNGGSLFSAFDNIHYLFGTGTFSDTVAFTHTFWSDPPLPPLDMTGIGGIGGIGGLGGAFAATAFSAATGFPVQPNLPVTVTVDYNNTDTGPTIPGTLALWWLNLGQWTRLPSVDDPASGVMTATVNHLSDFAVFGETHRLFLPMGVR